MAVISFILGNRWSYEVRSHAGQFVTGETAPLSI